MILKQQKKKKNQNNCLGKKKEKAFFPKKLTEVIYMPKGKINLRLLVRALL